MACVRSASRRPEDYIQCPVDLDALVMSPACTPEYIEENLGVSDDIMWDAIRLSTCQYWLLKIDVLEGFSFAFRRRIYRCLPAFSRMNRKYFAIRMSLSRNNDLKDELDRWVQDNGPIDDGNNLINPMNMLSNNLKEHDLMVIEGRMTLSEFIVLHAREFIDTGDKNKIDFSCSLFLPEILNPKFFSGTTEAEKLVVLGNMDRYFKFVEKFNKTGVGLRGSYQPKHELNDPQNLLKHVLSGDYADRTKMIAWKQLYSEMERLVSRPPSSTITSPSMPPMLFKVFNESAILASNKGLLNLIKAKGYEVKDLVAWLVDADGVFEAFELACTLHNLDASDFFELITTSIDDKVFKMAPGLVAFQDSETRDRLFRRLADKMVSFR